MTGRLEGKTAIITGGTRGIGLAIAKAFAAEGAKVAVASRKQPNVDAAVEAINQIVQQIVQTVDPGSGGAGYGRVCHVGDRAAIGEFVDWVEAEVGAPDVLVNNAATNPYFGPLLGATEAVWDKTFDVNLKGYFEPSRLVAQRLLAKNRPGSIVNITSVAGIRGTPLQGIYAMTKAAVISMTQTLAVELGAGNIRVNAIAPGLVETRLAAAITSSEELSKYFTDRAPLKRHAQPEEIAGLAVYLASDEASYVTGQTIRIDGGWSIA